MIFADTYGHTPYEKAFTQGDVYGIGYDSERVGRRSIKLGIIGAGGVAQSKYFPAIARLRMIWEPVEIVAFAEPRQDHARKVQAIYGGRWYTDYGEMLAQETLDGVLVLSPDSLHREHTLACLQAGVHVLVEKPIARSLADAQEMCRTADERHLTLMTVANKRCSPPYRRAKAILNDGAIGHPALFTGKFMLGYDYVDLLESGTIHLFDLALYLMGSVSAVSAAGMKSPNSTRAYPIENAALTLQFTSGAVGSMITSSTALSFKAWERVEIHGDHAWLEVEDQYELRLHDSEMGATQSWRPVIPNTLLFDEEFGGYMSIVENFAQSIRVAEIPVVTGWDGYRAYELLTATHLSLARHAWVSLPLDPILADAEVSDWLSKRTQGANQEKG
jgi:predicted dehydrogenase